MKSAELRDLSVEELGRKAAEMRENMFNLRIRHAAGTLDSSATLGTTRRELARVLTVLTQKQAGQAKAPAKPATQAEAPAKAAAKAANKAAPAKSQEK